MLEEVVQVVFPVRLDEVSLVNLTTILLTPVILTDSVYSKEVPMLYVGEMTVVVAVFPVVVPVVGAAVIVS